MKFKNLLAALFLSSILFTGCDKKEDDPTPTPTTQPTNNPTTNPTAPAMTAKINGSDWTAAVPMANLQNGDFTLAGASMSGQAVGMYAMGANISQTGTYAVTAVYSEITPGQSSGPVWAGPQGTVTITKLDLAAKKVSGTFSFTGYPDPTSGAIGIKTISTGVFNEITLQ